MVAAAVAIGAARGGQWINSKLWARRLAHFLEDLGVGKGHPQMGEYLKLTVDGPVANVTMARPDVHNAFSEHLIAQLHDAFRSLGEDDSVRVVVLTGEGKSFSAGADLDWMRRAA